ncbi:MAG: PEP-CTERM sorting domain-containing protein, partial [Sphingorhabdus sp.]
VSLVAPSGLRFLPDLVRQATGTPGSRRRSIAPLASGQPLTSSPEGSAPSGLEQANQATSGANPITGNQLALADSPPGGGTGGGGAGAGSGGAGGGGFGPGIGGGGGSPITTVSLLDPTDPTEGTPEPEVPVVPPVAAAIPEPGVWLLFLVGLFFSAAALRREASVARTQSV